VSPEIVTQSIATVVVAAGAADAASLMILQSCQLTEDKSHILADSRFRNIRLICHNIHNGS
jgi:hypothetical protein